jgi:hypothetical protein
MRKFVFTQPDQYKLVTSICDAAGIEDPGTVIRIVVDLRYGEPGKLYVEQFGDEAILDVDIATLGSGVREEDPDPAPDGYFAHRAGPGAVVTYEPHVERVQLSSADRLTDDQAAKLKREWKQDYERRTARITDNWYSRASIGARLKHLMGRT